MISASFGFILKQKQFNPENAWAQRETFVSAFFAPFVVIESCTKEIKFTLSLTTVR